MLKFTDQQISDAMGRAIDRCIHMDNKEERGFAIREAALHEGIAIACAAFAWSEQPPSEPGLYAVCEQFGDKQRHDVLPVELHASGELVYGGIRRVADAPAGTLWHRLSPLPTQG